MLGWALTFLVLAIIAGVFGFGLVAFAAAEIARVLCFLFIALSVIGLIGGWRRRTP